MRADGCRKAIRWFANGFALVFLVIVAANFVVKDGLSGLATFLLGFSLYALGLVLIPLAIAAPIIAITLIAAIIRRRRTRRPDKPPPPPWMS